MISDSREWLQKYAVDAIDQRPAGTVIVDLNGVIRYSNKKIQILLGYTPKKIVGKHIHTVFCSSKSKKSDHKKQECNFLLPLQRGMPQTRKIYSVYDSGALVRWFEVSAYPLIRRGNIEAAVIAFANISTSLRNASELEMNLAKVKAFFNAGDYGMIIIDDELYVLAANDAVYALSSINTLIGHSITSIVPTKDRPRFKSFITKGLKASSQKPLLFFFITEDGEKVWWDFNIEADFIPHNHAIFFNDVTRQQKEVKRREQFLGLVSHELKNPLAVVKAYTQLLQRRLKGTIPSKYVSFLAKIYDQSNILERLIEDIVDEYRVGASKLILEPVDLDLSELLKEVVENYKKIQPKRKITMLHLETAPVEGDHHRLSQVIMNLLTNADKYSPLDLPIKIDLTIEDDQAILSVTNYGKGITKEEKTQIFEPFFRSKNAAVENKAGLGLGLYLSKHIIKLHRGKIWFDSTKAKTVFFVKLPLRTD